jgi:hypothetical protein
VLAGFEPLRLDRAVAAGRAGSAHQDEVGGQVQARVAGAAHAAGDAVLDREIHARLAGDDVPAADALEPVALHHELPDGLAGAGLGGHSSPFGR